MVRVKVRTSWGEAEVEAEPEQVREAIALIPEILARLSDASKAEAPKLSRNQEASGKELHPVQVELPTVTVEKSDSLADIIGKFFADPWGRESRKLSDVREALQSYGLNYPKQSVAVALLRLAKTTRIRRFKAEDGEYVYTASSVSATSPQ